MKIYLIPLLCVFSTPILAATDNTTDNTEIKTELKPSTITKTDTSVKLGATLHNAHCVACHSNMFDGNASLLYTRKDHNVSTLAGLSNQVQACVTNLKLDWFDGEIENVTNYLNAEYYHY